MNRLSGKKVAAIATNGFEEDELLMPLRALQSEGATVEIVSPEEGTIRGWKNKDWSCTVDVQTTLDAAIPSNYDALLIPGGVINPDTLRMNPAAVEFVRAFFDSGKPVAAICHGPVLLIEADVVTGRELTSYRSIRTDLENAGALWVDEEVVVDDGLVTSRTPDDLTAFISKTIEEIEEGVHEQRV